MDQTEKIAAILERLEEQLAEKDARIEELEGKLKVETDRESYRWTHHRSVSRDENPDLPVPRLQLRYTERGDINSWYSYTVTYELVYQHYLEGLGGGKDLVAVPLGSTVVNGNGVGIMGVGAPVRENGEISLPMRDGVHIISDSVQLNLPMFAVCGDVAKPIPPKDLNFKKGHGVRNAE